MISVVWGGSPTAGLASKLSGVELVQTSGSLPNRGTAWAFAALVASTLSILPGTAHAQSNESSPTFRAYQRVGKSCVSEARRFCPAADPAAPQPRAMAICLRPYRASLSLACRGAVNAVSR